MAQLTDLQIFDAALRAGFTPDQAVTMTAIALAESGGNTEALNSEGEHSVGLWQINTAVHDLDPAAATDPVVNARMAYEVSNGGADITRWTVTHEVSNARYLKFRERAEAAADAAGYDEAVGQWDAPHDYHSEGVGAAGVTSTSEAVFAAGPVDGAPIPLSAETAGQSVAESVFDRDGDGVFDAVENWLGEDLLANGAGAGLAAGEADHAHFHGEPLDPSMVRNGQLNEAALESVTGGDDFLAEGAPAHSWEAMVAAAAAEGVNITFSDAYRPLHDQERLARELGLYSAGGRAAVPGTSNHGLGLAVDVNRTPETMAWLDANASRFGWVADVPREPWHFNYRAERDPDPGRAAVGLPETDGDDARLSAFDRDGDGTYDTVESWIEARGGSIPDSPNDSRAEEFVRPPQTGDGSVRQAPILPASMSEEPADELAISPASDPPGPAEDPGLTDLGTSDVGEADVLAPIEPRDDSDLSRILERFDLDAQGDLVISDLSGDDRAGLRDALVDYVGEHSDLDAHAFGNDFDHFVDEHQGVVAFDEVLSFLDFDI